MDAEEKDIGVYRLGKEGPKITMSSCFMVTAIDKDGKIQHQQGFYFRMKYDHVQAAENHAANIRELFPDCTVTVEGR